MAIGKAKSGTPFRDVFDRCRSGFLDFIINHSIDPEKSVGIALCYDPAILDIADATHHWIPIPPLISRLLSISALYPSSRVLNLQHITVD
jgi:hypothetical protein